MVTVILLDPCVFPYELNALYLKEVADDALDEAWRAKIVEYQKARIVNVTVKAYEEANPSNFVEYKVEVERKDGTASYALFDVHDRKDGYYDAEEDFYVPFAIYVPENLQPGEKLPVVYTLHGNGESQVPMDFVFKRNQLATTWAKDSEVDPAKRAIVLMPKNERPVNNYTENWHANYRLTRSGRAAYNLLQELINGKLVAKDGADYTNLAQYIDKSRIYVAGLSMGGGGSFASIIEHPETFAGAFINCAANGVPGEDDFKIFSEDVALLFAIAAKERNAAMNPLDNPDSLHHHKLIPSRMPEGRYRYIVYPEGTYLYAMTHYSWCRTYADEEAKTWLFSQIKEQQK